MGVYIKGMEMPVTCCHCPLMGYDPDREWFDSTRTGAHICVLTGELIDNTKREEHCPLVSVQPHGRPGDLDNFALLVLNWISTQEKAYPHEDSNALAWRLGAKAMGNQIYRNIKAYPTIIPAEEGE